jgi:competence ComEA-like helix-hairpin-helix protein
MKPEKVPEMMPNNRKKLSPKKAPKRPISESSEESSENQRLELRSSRPSYKANNIPSTTTRNSSKITTGQKRHYKPSSSSSTGSEVSSSDDDSRSHQSEDSNSSSSSQSSSSYKKSKSKKPKSATTALRSIQLPKEKVSKDSTTIKTKFSPSQKILSLLNTADEKKLKQRLACIGPKRAQQIVKYRDKNGSYSSIDELTQLEGIGSKWVKSFIESNQDI